MHTKTIKKTTPAILAELSFFKGMYLLLIVLYLFPIEVSLAQKSTVSEKLISIKTYDFDDPNPIATLASGKHHIYPYFQFDGYRLQPEQKEWKVVTLENDYIEVQILPEVGGKVWGASEKSTGEEFLYKNEVLKFRNIALRGPWTSGGIEFNFGITGHAPTTSTPVDYIIKEHSDGSVSCTIGAVDLPSGTAWRVIITLPADKAYFETTSFQFNLSDIHQSNYVWQNAAIVADQDLEFFYPGSFFAGHPGDVHPWPIHDDGRNLAMYKNNNFGSSKSYHVVGKADPGSEYFGAYWHEKEIGTGNWSYYGDAPGKKLWIWAQSRSGGIWEDLLTDTDGQYVEIQSGRFFTQAAGNSPNTPFDYNALTPSTTKHWSEIWFPLVNTPGISAASPKGVLHVQEEDENLDEEITVTFMALEPVDTSMRLYDESSDSGTPLISYDISLKPLEKITRAIAYSELNGFNKEDLKIVMRNRDLVYRLPTDTGKQNGNKEQFRPDKTPQKLKPDTPAHYYNLGENQYNHRQYREAAKNLKIAIHKDPALLPAYNVLAELYYRNALPDSALLFAKQSLALNTYNPYGNYIAGLALAQKGQIDDAIGAFSWAARSLEYSSAANTKIAELYLKEVYYNRASKFAQRALENNPLNIEAMQLLAMLHRLQDDEIKADSMLNRIYSVDKLNHFARFERYLLNSEQKTLEDFRNLIRNELPAETYLGLAVFYLNAGRQQDAITLLRQTNNQNHAIIKLWLAYLTRIESPGQSKKYLDDALTSSPAFIFPHRTQTLEILNWAREQTNNWVPNYYLGLIYWHKQQPDLARKIFNELGNRPDYGPFYIMRAELNKSSANDSGSIRKDLTRALDLSPESWRSWHALNTYYVAHCQLDELLDNAEQAYQKFPKQDAIKMGYAQALLLNGHYEQCVTHLNTIRVLPFEGAQAGRVLQEQAHLLAAIHAVESQAYKKALKFIDDSRDWPEHLGVGQPYNPDLRLKDLLTATVYKLDGRSKKAKPFYLNIRNYTEQYPSKTRTQYLAHALATYIMGDTAKADELMDAWLEADPDNPLRIALHSQYKDGKPSTQINEMQDVQLRLLSHLVKLAKTAGK
mgnify:CR=1 FL=1